MERPFHHNLVKVKNKQFFGVVQNANYFYKGQYLASSILAFYLDPYFCYLYDDFDEYITENKGTEEDWFSGSRIEKEVEGKSYYASVFLQKAGSLQVNSYLQEDWEDIKYMSFLPSFSSIYHFDHKPNTSPWLTDELHEKFKNFFLFCFKEFFPDVIELVHKFKYQIEKNKGEIYSLEESLVDHFSSERKIELHPFFSPEDLKIIIYAMESSLKPEPYNNTSFITSYTDYKNFLLDFYGEKGSCCKYTNFNESFLEPYKTIEELMYVDWISGAGGVAERKKRGEKRFFPFPIIKESYSGWVVMKKLTDSLSKII